MKRIEFYGTSLHSIESQIANGSRSKAAILSSIETVSYFNALNLKNGFIIHIVPERISSISLTIYFRKNSYLIEPVNEELFRYISNGFILHWMDEIYLDAKLVKKMTATNERVLKWNDVEGIFEIFGISLLIATFAFIVELLYDKIRKQSFFNILFKQQ